MVRPTPTRRRLLVAGASGAASALAGCSSLGGPSGGDEETDRPDTDPPPFKGAWRVLSSLPVTVLPGERPPLVVARPARFADYRADLADTVVASATALATAGGLLPFGLADVAGVATSHSVTVAAAEFDAGELTDALADDGFKQAAGDDAIYIDPRDPVAVAVGDGWLAVGHETHAAAAAETVAAAVDARDADGSALPSGASEVARSLSDADYAVVQPVDAPGRSAPERGVFETERAYGVGVGLGDERTTLRYRRRFEDSPGESAVGRWVDARTAYRGPADPDVTTTDATVSVEGAVPTTELSLYHLAGQCRDAAATGFPSNEPFVRKRDGGYDVYGWAQQFTYVPYSTDEPTLERGRQASFHLTSRDVLHGFAVPGLAVRRLLVPGEVTTAERELADAGTYRVRCSHYCGRGHRAMDGRLRVRGSGRSWLEGANGYDGTVYDRRGRDRVTVEVGAESDTGPYSFAPAGVRVSPGATVVWTWVSDTHSVTAKDGPFGSGVRDEGATFERTFESTGAVRYYCRPHKSLGMKGAVLVGE